MTYFIILRFLFTLEGIDIELIIPHMMIGIDSLSINTNKPAYRGFIRKVRNLKNLKPKIDSPFSTVLIVENPNSKIIFVL